MTLPAVKRHYLYRLTDPASGDFYVGVRSCGVDPANDLQYKGSGRWPRHCAYLLVKLRKDILAEFPSRLLAEEAEQLLIDLALQDSRCCNSVKTASAAFKAASKRQCRAHVNPAVIPEKARQRVYG